MGKSIKHYKEEIYSFENIIQEESKGLHKQFNSKV